MRSLWSRFASPKSEEARLESLADPSAMAGLDENDPRAVAQFMKKMGKEMGEDFDGDIGHFVNEKVHCIPGIQDTKTIITFKAF